DRHADPEREAGQVVPVRLRLDVASLEDAREESAGPSPREAPEVALDPRLETDPRERRNGRQQRPAGLQDPAALPESSLAIVDVLQHLGEDDAVVAVVGDAVEPAKVAVEGRLGRARIDVENVTHRDAIAAEAARVAAVFDLQALPAD